MIIRIVRKNIEDHPPEHFLTIRFRKAEPSTDSQKLLIAFRFGANGGKRLRVEFLSAFPIETHCQKIIVSVNLV